MRPEAFLASGVQPSAWQVAFIQALAKYGAMPSGLRKIIGKRKAAADEQPALGAADKKTKKQDAVVCSRCDVAYEVG